MPELIANTIFLISLLILIITFYRVYELSILYEDKKSGLVIIAIGVAVFVVIILSLLTSLFAIDTLGLHIFTAESGQTERSISILISSLFTYFISSKFKITMINYCRKEGMIALKQ